MDALLVIAGALLFMRLVGLVVLILADRADTTAGPVPPRVDPCLGPVQGLPPATGAQRGAGPRPGRPDGETVLLSRLTSGRLSREQYRAAMADLARRDSHAVR
ncbi:hypothetical protein Ait01nite_027650 [Actinoplanes italicus]|uniref:Uncharacterized protein n=1 Tax=Actinoplanes italicus TaxID=113567 RepID=A0A2T0KEQ3_9ACTN|nr:hypothetical protein [Actinoplanes italicus]PRX21863.1 hypothetical protein CLV67_10540 [Actinoplanes italicus]GIE29720.1 hypothetical protein Ait01nite_027650 [Actinoplanes italicus]